MSIMNEISNFVTRLIKMINTDKTASLLILTVKIIKIYIWLVLYFNGIGSRLILALMRTKCLSSKKSCQVS